MAALVSRKRILLAKIESSYGVDPTPTGAANAILVRNMSLTPLEADYAPRDLVRPYLGNSEQIPAGARVKCEFEVEMQGSGTAGTAPAYDALLRACGFSSTNTPATSQVYAPISTGFESVTIYYNVDGVLHKALGCRGNVSIEVNVKGIPVFKFTFTGIYGTPTDTAAATPTYTGFKTPVAVTNVNTTPFSLHSISAVMSQLTIDMGNQIVHRTLVGGSEQVLLVDRKPVGSITIEATTVATKDWWTAVKNVTTGALALTHGITAGFKVALAAPALQLTNPVYQDLDGVAMAQFNFNLVPSTSGNDEFTITVT